MSVVLMEELCAYKLALIIPKIEAVDASVICLFPTIAYFYPLKMVVTTQIFFVMVRSKYHVHD